MRKLTTAVLVALLVAVPVIAFHENVEPPEGMDQRGDLIDVVTDFSGTTSELIELMKSACLNSYNPHGGALTKLSFAFSEKDGKTGMTCYWRDGSTTRTIWSFKIDSDGTPIFKKYYISGSGTYFNSLHTVSPLQKELPENVVCTTYYGFYTVCRGD